MLLALPDALRMDDGKSWKKYGGIVSKPFRRATEGISKECKRIRISKI